MSLTWQGFTAADFAAELEASATETRRASKVILRAGAKEIMETSKEMCPVDDGELEQAHRLNVVRLNKDDMEVEIEVGGIVNGVDVSAYAWEQHERLAPYGDMHLGPKSEAKDAANPPERFVGGKFLERAADIHEEDIASKLYQTMPGD